MKTDRLILLGALCGALLGAGCAATLHARLYDLQSAEILQATYKMNGSGHGPIWLGPTQQTATCQGEYVTVPHGTEGWGLIFSGAAPSLLTAIVTDSDQHGRAIVTCGDGRVIECEYISSALTGGGHGSCQDNTARHYRLMF